MEFKVEQEELNRALNKFHGLVAKKSTIPIFSYLLLESQDGTLSLSGSDLDVSVKLKIPAKVIEPGALAVSSKMLADIVRELTSGEVLFKLDQGNRLRIKYARSQFKLVGVAQSQFPELPGLNVSPQYQIQADVLSEMINRTLYAVANDDARYNMGGVCFESPYEGCLRLVATDGHRLAMVTRENSTVADLNRFIVPKRGLAESRRVLDDLKGVEISFGFEEGFFVLKADNEQIAIRLIDEEFPEYSEVIPLDQGNQITLDCDLFSQALRRVALMVSDQNKCIRMEFTEGSLIITSSSPELGEAREELEIDYPETSISIGFNARFLIDVCGSLGESGEVIIELLGAMEPAKFYAPGDDSCLAVVMPMRLEEYSLIDVDSDVQQTGNY